MKDYRSIFGSTFSFIQINLLLFCLAVTVDVLASFCSVHHEDLPLHGFRSRETGSPAGARPTRSSLYGLFHGKQQF